MTEAMRMCAGCRARAPQRDLVRVVWHADGVVLDPRRRLPGRGVNLHLGCAPLVVRNRGIARGLRREVDAEQVRALLESLGQPRAPGDAVPDEPPGRGPVLQPAD